jgi:hypothetical protein
VPLLTDKEALKELETLGFSFKGVTLVRVAFEASLTSDRNHVVFYPYLSGFVSVHSPQDRDLHLKALTIFYKHNRAKAGWPSDLVDMAELGHSVVVGLRELQPAS